MGFYYFSILSVIPLALAYGALALTFALIERKTRGRPGRKPWLIGLAVVILLLPISEELWIAWNFGQACKEAGTFIHKKVQVEGFYDSTMRSAYENTKPGRYRFVEHATEDRKGYERVTVTGAEDLKRAMDWYASRNPGKELPKDRAISYPLDDRQRIVVIPNGAEAWRVTTLDRPTARYHYRTVASHKPVAHQLKRFEDEILDTQSGEIIAKRIDFARGSNWFYIGLDRPTIQCKANIGKPLLIYHDVLLPARQR
jgi:hypothetical protein